MWLIWCSSFSFSSSSSQYGWYWGPISSEAAEKILSNEPDGSFIVRDSSDDHYIFSLTFKLNNSVRHVRIEQDQGTFSFGSCAKFKSRTIMEFIENAVESSRSGRWVPHQTKHHHCHHVHLLTDHSIYFCAQISILFPSTTRTWTDASSIDQSGVALQAHPEFATHVQVDWLRLESSYDRHTNLLIHIHSCRFVIRRAVVRKDLIQSLPLPRRLLDYLSYKNCYSELVESDSSQSPTSEVQPHLNSALSALFI